MLITVRLTLAVFTLISLALNAAGAEELRVPQFIGPHVGNKYVYTASDGGRVEILGLKETENSLDVEETTFIPKALVLAGFPERTTIKYTLRVSDIKLVKEFGTAKEILLRAPLEVAISEWCISGKAMKREESGREALWSDVTSICRIVHAEHQDILGKRRVVLTTECRTLKMDSTFIRRERYAQGIGMIERTLLAVSKQGKVDEIHSVTLQDIIYSEKPDSK